MISRYFLLFLKALTACGVQPYRERNGVEQEPPKIIFFIADDMTREICNCLPEVAGKNLTPISTNRLKKG